LTFIKGFSGRGLAESGSNLFPHGLESTLVVHLERFVSHPDLARIGPLGFDEVTPDLVSVATTTTRTFKERYAQRDEPVAAVALPDSSG
jgi:hypothetical protein